jgi:hypothetical protein
MKEGDKDICFFCIFISFIIVYVVYFLIEDNETSYVAMKTRTIEEDGYSVFQCSDHNDINNEPSEHLIKITLDKLPEGYEFMDYSYRIKSSGASMFHRDVTSSQNIYDTEHPVYTLILYKHDGCLLSLCPGSNFTYPFVYSKIVNINGEAGTCILFHSDVLHAGCFNQCAQRNVIQYKIAHRSDFDALTHLDGVNVEETEGSCENNIYNHLLRKCSYFFELPINTIFHPFMQKQQEDGFIKDMQKYSSLRFYNNNI